MKKILLALAALLPAASALAVDYFVVVPMPGRAEESPHAPAPDKAPITVSLTPYELPDGMVNKEYSFDFKPLLSVEGDAEFSVDAVEWSFINGAPPAGLALAANGLLAGKPNDATTGAAFTIQASYKGADGAQQYLVKIGAQALQAVQVSAGGFHSCALTAGGHVLCWGNNTYGQLGDGTTTSRTQPKMVNINNIVQIETGNYHTCALNSSGTVYCWGSNQFGQLGSPSITHKSTPVAVSVGAKVEKLSGRYHHVCALTAAKALRCWGRNSSGQIGTGSTANSATVVTPTGMGVGVTDFATGESFTCAVQNNKPFCWGANSYHQYGDVASSLSPREVTHVSVTASSKVITGGAHTCLLTNGNLSCWGGNWSGQSGPSSSDPTNAIPLANVTAVAANDENTCALAEGVLYCWGGNHVGQLGTGTVQSSAVSLPQKAEGLRDVVSLSVGRRHVCATEANNVVKCWGYNNAGQVGYDTSGANALTAGAVQPGVNIHGAPLNP